MEPSRPSGRAGARSGRRRDAESPTSLGAAFFDLDRTLLAGGSGPVFARTLERLGVATPKVPGLATMFKFFDLFGESYLVMQLARRSAGRVRGLDRAMVQAGAEVAADELVERLQPFVPGVLDDHRRDGDLLVLATTSPHDLVAPFARRLGFDAVVATRYEADDEGRYTGDLDGIFVWGPGKLAAVQAWAATEGVDLARSAAYSDSVFDAPLLGAVGRPTAVNPDARLRALAAARRWPVRSFSTPEGVPAVNGVEPFDLVRPFVRPELLGFADLQISGLEHLPTSGPAIVVANHRSYFDPLALGMAIARAGRNPRFLGKKEVFDAPVVGQIATAFGGIRVDRGTGSDAPLLEAAAALRGGDVVVILPQGTIPRGEAFFDPELVGRPGVARLAAMCPDVPIVPVGLWGTEKVWPRSSKVPRVWTLTNRPVVTVRVGAPVAGLALVAGREGAASDTALVMAAIMELLPPEARIRREVSAAELAATVPDGDLSKVRTDGPRPDVPTATAGTSTSLASSARRQPPSSSKTQVTGTKAGVKTAPQASEKATTTAAKTAAKRKPATATPGVGKPGAAKSVAAKPVATGRPSASVRAGAKKPGAPSRRLPGSVAKRA